MSQADRQEATHRHVRRAAHLIASQLSDRPAIAIGTLAGALGVPEPGRRRARAHRRAR